MAKLFFICVCWLHLIVAGAQDQTNPSGNQVRQLKSLGIQYDNYLMGHPLIIKNGLSVTYIQPIWQKRKHHVSVSPRIGWISMPKVENKYFANPSINYHFLTKRFYSNVGLGVQYTVSVLKYERYEYVDNLFTKQSSIVHNFGPSVHVSFGYKVWTINQLMLSPYISIASSQFYTGYLGKISEGQKPSFSLGLHISKAR